MKVDSAFKSPSFNVKQAALIALTSFQVMENRLNLFYHLAESVDNEFLGRFVDIGLRNPVTSQEEVESDFLNLTQFLFK